MSKRKLQKQNQSVTAHSHSARSKTERPISDAYPEIDNDLARDNLENDIPECDLPD